MRGQGAPNEAGHEASDERKSACVDGSAYLDSNAGLGSRLRDAQVPPTQKVARTSAAELAQRRYLQCHHAASQREHSHL